MSPRYAIYFTPAHASSWWEFGASWLGRDERGDTALVQPPLAQIAHDELQEITAQPRRYGFHATLKAPFSLSVHHTIDDLIARLHELAATLKPVLLGPLQVTTLGNFVALVPALATDELMALAAACVTGLDDFRAPLTEGELARRRIEHLNAREQELLQRYGYPYVLERFRFHFTLSGPLEPPATRATGGGCASGQAQ